MAKRLYICNECGHTQPKWAGRCPDCGSWNTLVETEVRDRRTAHYAGITESRVLTLGEVTAQKIERASSGIEELDRILGGGLVPGAAILLGGDPGIGKSTLLLQVAALLSRDCEVLYVSGEESLEQIGLRAQRLEMDASRVKALAETHLEQIEAAISKHRPQLLMIDSIQTLYTETLSSAPGSVSQVRECAARLVRLAKSNQMTLFLVGHVTKEGAIAGPRVLEHMVDTVLYFEGEKESRLRGIRAIKNRFGPTGELGVFAMTDCGLREVKNPSALFLAKSIAPVAGSAVGVIWEGTRPLLIEVQALVDDSVLAAPRRVTVGIDPSRLAILLAILHRQGGIRLSQKDIFVNVVGGIRIQETASDLAVVAALLSSCHDRPLARDWLFFGEVGLTGEIRPVPHGEERLREAQKQGFKYAVVPDHNLPRRKIKGLEVIGAKTVQEVVALL